MVDFLPSCSADRGKARDKVRSERERERGKAKKEKQKIRQDSKIFSFPDETGRVGILSTKSNIRKGRKLRYSFMGILDFFRFGCIHVCHDDAFFFISTSFTQTFFLVR